MQFDPNVARVQVIDELGKVVWRKPEEIKPTDHIKVHPQTGLPITMANEPGRKNINQKTTPPSTPTQSTTPAQPSTANPNPNLIPPQIQIAYTQAQLNVATQHLNRVNSISKDKVFEQTIVDSESSEVLNAVLQGLAEESANLKFEREEAERKGENTSQLSIRRVNALKAVGDTWLKKKEIISNQMVDIEGKSFKVLFGFIAETFRKACDNAKVRPEMSESIFANFGKLIDDEEWSKEAKARMEKGE